MALASSRDVMAYMQASMANALGHAVVGIWGRRVTYALIAVSAVLSAVASAGVFADAFSKAVVGWAALAASIASALAIFCLTTLKFDAHLRLQGAYESVRTRLVQCQVPRPGYEAQCDELFNECISDFNRAVETAGHEKALLTGRRVDKYEEKARKKILASNEVARELKASMPAPIEKPTTAKGEALPRLPPGLPAGS
jgi:hypothetical protein